jgi:hypothetical protein
VTEVTDSRAELRHTATKDLAIMQLLGVGEVWTLLENTVARHQVTHRTCFTHRDRETTSRVKVTPKVSGERV